MAAADRPSPRTAIRSWLDNTKSSSRAGAKCADDEPYGRTFKSRHRSGQQKQESRPLIESIGHDEYRIHSTRREEGKLHEAPDSDTHSRIPFKPHGGGQIRYRTKLKPSETKSAEVLGLHTPFRNLRDRDNDPEVNANGLVRQRKRRRRASSTTSYLEPAAPDGFTDGHDRQPRPDYRLDPNKSSPGESNNSCSSGSWERDALATDLSERPTKSYERRPRHKTREDHYELKEGSDGKRTRAREDGERGKKKRRMDQNKQKKHKRRKKSGAALMHDFAARNVASDRLTLQPAKTLGLFGNGRASSPIKRKGLPDLAFSESAFLKSRQMQVEDPAAHKENRPPTKSRKSTRGVDTEAEISRYFTSAKIPIRDATRPGENPQQKEVRKRSMNYDFTPAFIDLPDKPFLGFGNCNISVSPMKELDGRTLADIERQLTRSPTRSTSYFSWSQTEFQSQDSRQGSATPFETMRYSDPRRRSPASEKPVKPNLPLPSPKFPKLSGTYRNAATSTAPLKRHCNGALNLMATTMPLNDGHCHSESDSWKEHKTAELDVDHEERELHLAETILIEKLADETTTMTKEPEVRKQVYNDFFQPCIKLNLRNEELEHQAQASMTRPGYHSAYPTTLDPLETMLEDMPEGKRCDWVSDATPPTIESSRRDNLIQAAAAGPIGSPCSYPQRIDLCPHVSKLPSASSPLECLGSGSEAGRNVRRYKDMKTLEHKTRDSARTTSEHTLRSPNRPPAVIYVPNRLSNFDRSKANSGNAWNGYNTIYESQQDAANASLTDSRTYETEFNNASKDHFTQPYLGATTSAYLIYEDEGLLVEMQGRSSEYTPDLSAGQKAVDTERDNLQQGPLRDDLGVNQDQGEEVWTTEEEFVLARQHYDHHSVGRGNAVLVCDSAQDGRDIETRDQSSHRGHTTREKFDQRPRTNQSRADYHPWLPEYSSPVSIGHPRFHGSTSILHQQDNPAPSGFWTPHKLY